MTKKKTEKTEEPRDEYAEVPEEVLDKEDLKELQEIKNEKEFKTNEKEKTRPSETWEPKTKLGIEVKNGKIKDIDDILKSKREILEAEITDYLLPLKSDLISIGQSKGKFGGGKRRAWRQTQRKTEEGNVPTFSAMAIVGDENGHVGFGYGKSMETLPARDKALRKAKLNVIKVTRGCSGFDCDCSELHTVPFKVTGKAGSSRITLIPAPQGTGLVVANELKKVLKLAGIKDVYSKSFGKARTSFNLIKACFDALQKTNSEEVKEE
ncbi:MAG: 30S ribosomal protein S5 [Nanobdellota archaeon]